MHANDRTYLYTDMAAELFHAAKKEPTGALHPTGNPLNDCGIDYTERYFGTIRCEKLVIADAEASSVLGKSVGTYYTVHTGNLLLLDETDAASCRDALRTAVLDAAVQLCPDFKLPIDRHENNTIGKTAADAGFDKGCVYQTAIDDPGMAAWDRLAVSPEWDLGGHLYNAPPLTDRSESPCVSNVRAEGEPFLSPDDSRSAVTDIPPVPQSEQTPFRPMTILVVGLGNPALTTDALGPMCVSNLCVTRHMVGDTPHLPQEMQLHHLCAITPLVLGKTGIETLELVRGAVEAVHPDLVILIDALAASELASLAQTVQIATTGIHPGGGVGNKRLCLDKDTLGVPVMTIGVPTVVAASTLIYRALEGAGILPQDDDTDVSHLVHAALAAADVGYVAPKDIDETLPAFSRLIAHTVNTAALGEPLTAALRCGI